MILPSKDIHNHLLPGVDDGFSNAADSLRAIRTMAEEGCREIVFSPHMNPDVYPDINEDDFRRVYDEFNAQIPQDWGVKTSLAAEYMVVRGFEKRASDPNALLKHPDGSVLIEMSYYFRSDNLEDTIFELTLAGYKPIIAHPERYLYMADDLHDYAKWRDMGCRFQLNLMSLSGMYGPQSVKIMRHLFKEGFYDMVATDLHSNAQLQRILDLEPGWRLRRLLRKSGIHEI